MADLKVIEPKRHAPNAQAIELIQGLLLEAESGALQSIAIACVYGDREARNDWAIRDGNYTDTKAQVDLMSDDLSDEIRGKE